MRNAAPSGLGSKLRRANGLFGNGVRVRFVHFEYRVQALDVPIDQVEQDLSALGFVPGAEQIGPPLHQCLPIAVALLFIEIAQEVIELIFPDGIEAMAGHEDLGNTPIFIVDGIAAQKADGFEAILRLPEIRKRELPAQRLPAVA